MSEQWYAIELQTDYIHTSVALTKEEYCIVEKFLNQIKRSAAMECVKLGKHGYPTKQECEKNMSAWWD